MTDKTAVPHYGMFIDGGWVDAPGRYEVIDPATDTVVFTAAKGTVEHADLAVQAAKRAFKAGVWRNTPPEERAALLERFADAWEARQDELAELTTKECGIPIRLGAVFGVLSPTGDTRYFAKTLRRFEWERPAPVNEAPLGVGIIRREPVGVCLGIVPWNTPLALAVWKAMPALAAGNSVVLKVDEKTPVSALEMAAVLYEVGLPQGVLNVVTGDGPTVGTYLTEHPDVAHVSFTGSSATGARVMSTAGKSLKRTLLELGGKGPNIVLDDADLDLAVDGSIWAFMMHSGQACESGTRLLLHEAIHDEFIARMVDRVATMKLGDTLDLSTDVGPLISPQQRKRVLDYIEAGKREGARVAIGGGVPAGERFDKGNWVEPTIFVNAANDMIIAREEIFGPVLTVIKYSTVDEAVKIANDTDYGLSAGIWSQDISRALDIARSIEAGSVWINDFHCCNPRYPFGGYKKSGVGRELGDDVLLEYTEGKVMTVNLAAREQAIGKFGLVLSCPAPRSRPL